MLTEKTLKRRFYDCRTWRSVRLKLLDAEPLCRRCASAELTTEACVGHHAPALDWPNILQTYRHRWGDVLVTKRLLQLVAERGGLDVANLEPLCAECHRQEHAPPEIIGMSELHGLIAADRAARSGSPIGSEAKSAHRSHTHNLQILQKNSGDFQK